MIGSMNRPGDQSNIIHPCNVQRQKPIQHRSWWILCDAKLCWITSKYFRGLIVSTYYILCISWIVKCLIIILEFVWRHSGRPWKPTSGESAFRLGFEAGRLAARCRHITALPSAGRAVPCRAVPCRAVPGAPRMCGVAQIECRQLPG
jgi:hypothetical protein